MTTPKGVSVSTNYASDTRPVRVKYGCHTASPQRLHWMSYVIIAPDPLGNWSIITPRRHKNHHSVTPEG